MGNIVKQGSRSSIGQGFQGTSDISLPKTKIIKYPTRPPLKVNIYDLNRLFVCLSVTIEAFLVDNFLPLIAGQCRILRLYFCAVPTRIGSPKSMRSRNTLKKNAILGNEGELSFIVDNFFLSSILVSSPTAFSKWR